MLLKGLTQHVLLKTKTYFLQNFSPKNHKILHHLISINSRKKGDNGHLSHSLNDEKMVPYVQLTREKKCVARCWGKVGYSTLVIGKKVGRNQSKVSRVIWLESRIRPKEVKSDDRYFKHLSLRNCLASSFNIKSYLRKNVALI